MHVTPQGASLGAGCTPPHHPDDATDQTYALAKIDRPEDPDLYCYGGWIHPLWAGAPLYTSMTSNQDSTKANQGSVNVFSNFTRTLFPMFDSNLEQDSE